MAYRGDVIPWTTAVKFSLAMSSVQPSASSGARPSNDFLPIPTILTGAVRRFSIFHAQGRRPVKKLAHLAATRERSDRWRRGG